MPTPQTIIASTPAELDRRVADFVEDAARRAIGARGVFHLCLAGGSTPEGAYRELRTPERTGRLDWSKVHFYWGDERPVGPDDPESNFRMAREALLDWIDIRDGQIHRIKGELPPEKAALDYARTLIDRFGRDADWPAFDLVMLGMGADGHTASLFPGTAALEEKQRWVVANPAPQKSTTRITLTLPSINHACDIVFMATGVEKSAAVAHARTQPGDPACPASLVQPLDGTVYWFLDEPAASHLS